MTKDKLKEKEHGKEKKLKFFLETTNDLSWNRLQFTI